MKKVLALSHNYLHYRYFPGGYFSITIFFRKSIYCETSLFIILNYIYASLWVCALENACADRGQGYWMSLELGLQGFVKHLMWFWELNSGSLEEQLLLLTVEPPLRPNRYYYSSLCLRIALVN